MSLETIVLSGGGARGFAYLGIIKYLEEDRKYEQVKRVIGVSIGSIFALMIAQKRSYEEVRAIMRDCPLPTIEDNCPIVNFYRLWTNHGCYTGNSKYDLIDLLCHGTDTFSELYCRTGIELTIVASNITKHKTEYFNYKSDPFMPIKIAVAASTAYPLIFQPIKYNKCLYVDGGLTCNVPTDYYPDDGVCFILEDEDLEINEEIGGLFDLLINIYKTSLTASNNYNTQKKVIKIKYSGVNGFDFDQPPSMIDSLVEVGYQSIVSLSSG